MKLDSGMKISRKLLLFSFAFIVGINAMAQTAGKRWSASVAMGLPVTFFSIKSQTVGIFTGAVRYSYTNRLSFEAKITSNTFYASTGNPYKATLNHTVSDVESYRTPVYGFTGMAYYNFHNFPGLASKPQIKLLPYVNGGIGINIYKPSATYVNGAGFRVEKFGKPFRDWQLGVGARYFFNSTIDVYGGVEYHISETWWLDGFKETTNPKLDQYLNLYAGVSIKIGAKPWDNLLDWAHKNVENPNEPAKNYARWSVDGTVGIPVLFTPVKGYKLTGMFGIGGRYSFNKAISAQVNYNSGSFHAIQSSPSIVRDGKPASVKEFKTRMNQVTVRGLFNLRTIASEPAQRYEWNHFAVIGAGYIWANGDVTYGNGTSFNDTKLYLSPGIQNLVIGYQARKYLTPNVDLIAGVDFNYNQSKYFDQGYDKKTLNNHLYFNAGVSYKIGAGKDREHIDWSYQGYNNYKDKTTTIEQVPVIEKPVTQEPKIDPNLAIVPPVDSPKVVEPAVVPAIEPVTPQVVEPVKPEPKPVTPKTEPATQAQPVEPKPKVTPKSKPSTPAVVTEAPQKVEYKSVSDIAPPPMKYNVIVACYSTNKLSVAKANQIRLERKGFTASIYRSSSRSQMLRMSVLSTDDRNEAIRMLRRARREIEPQSWIYIYNAQ